MWSNNYTYGSSTTAAGKSFLRRVRSSGCRTIHPAYSNLHICKFFILFHSVQEREKVIIVFVLNLGFSIHPHPSLQEKRNSIFWGPVFILGVVSFLWSICISHCHYKRTPWIEIFLQNCNILIKPCLTQLITLFSIYLGCCSRRFVSVLYQDDILSLHPLSTVSQLLGRCCTPVPRESTAGWGERDLN